LVVETRGRLDKRDFETILQASRNPNLRFGS
jgi:hypothetical protein